MIVKSIGVEVAAAVPPPYMPPGVPGLVTVTFAVPAVATALAGMVAITLVALANVVDIAVPLKFTTALPPKFDPSTSIVNCELPAAVLGGTKAAIAGVVPGCCGVVAWLE